MAEVTKPELDLKDHINEIRKQKIILLKRAGGQITSITACKYVACLPVQEFYMRIAIQEGLGGEGLEIIRKIEKYLFQTNKIKHPSIVASLAAFLASPDKTLEQCRLYFGRSNQTLTGKDRNNVIRDLRKLIPPNDIELLRFYDLRTFKEKKPKPETKPKLKLEQEHLLIKCNVAGDMVIIQQYEPDTQVGYSVNDFQTILDYHRADLKGKMVFIQTIAGIEFLKKNRAQLGKHSRIYAGGLKLLF